MNAISALSTLFFSFPENNQAKEELVGQAKDSLIDLSKKLNLDINNPKPRIYRPNKNQITDYNEILESHCQTYNTMNSILINNTNILQIVQKKLYLTRLKNHPFAKLQKEPENLLGFIKEIGKNLKNEEPENQVKLLCRICEQMVELDTYMVILSYYMVRCIQMYALNVQRQRKSCKRLTEIY